MADYGYVRVSSTDQHEDRQMIAMDELKIPASQTFTDKVSGKDFERPAYKALTGAYQGHRKMGLLTADTGRADHRRNDDRRKSGAEFQIPMAENP
jgi:hypothetical protein